MRKPQGFTLIELLVVMRPYYLDNPDLCFCPTATKPRRDEEADSTFGAWTNSYDEHGSYGINICITDPLPGREGGRPAEWYWRNRDVKGVANIPLFLDDYWWDTRRHTIRRLAGLDEEFQGLLKPLLDGTIE